ncbi:MAG: hypothetical protein Q9211_000633 [Gyalolechia sp. 1 TL-2023]
MALVREGVSDFVLFPQDQQYHELIHSSFDANLTGLDSSLRTTLAMQQSLADRGNTAFENPSTSAHVGGHANYYIPPNSSVDGRKEHARHYRQRYTPSGSTSPSISQSLDHPPSTISSASGASGQSTASSTVGSPYSLATHSLPSQDMWSEPNQGLGIAPDFVHNDGFPQDPFSNGSLENDLCFQDGKFSDNFVGSGSAAEKSFNRADVFKRHLTSLHGVEQTPPNSRKRSPATSAAKRTSHFSGDAAGKCSTCSTMFNNAQEFYEHLDDCVLRVVQQEEPSEAINEQHLAEVANDQSVLDTLDRNMMHTGVGYSDVSGKAPSMDGADEEKEDGVFEDEMPLDHWSSSTRSKLRSGRLSKPARVMPGGRKHGMTLSNGGVALVGRGRKKRKHYPVSWGCSVDKMKMKKRVLCVYDGPRRLWKDDMMLHSEFEVRMRLGGSDSYVTDLDVNTLKRADALLNATEAEKGPWMPEGVADVQRLMS